VKKRILVLLTAVALMVVMEAMAVAPAFAAAPSSHPTPANGNAFSNPSGEGVSTCGADPTCHGIVVGQHLFRSFPPGPPA
jgi:hypothetical protein